jgi:AraC-like DNA-binding protein
MRFDARRLMTAEAERFCIEASIAAMEPIIEELTGSPSNTLRIELPFARPARTEPYEVFRTANIQFDRPHAAYHGRRSDLDRSIPAQDGDVSEMLHQQCAHFLAMLTHELPLSERIEDFLRENAGEIPSIDDMASKLGMSRRSLQRELHNQDISYQQVVKRFRMRHALFLLGERRANIKMIAYMLGFQNVGSFRRAFHEWTGQSVGEWQASGSPAGEAGFSQGHRSPGDFRPA